MSELFEEKLSSRYFLSKMAIPYEYKVDTYTGTLSEDKTRFSIDLNLLGQTNINTGLRSPSQINYQKILKIRRVKFYDVGWEEKINLIERNMLQELNIFMHASFSQSEHQFVTGMPTDQHILKKKWIIEPNRKIDFWFTSDGMKNIFVWDLVGDPPNQYYPAHFIIEFALY